MSLFYLNYLFSCVRMLLICQNCIYMLLCCWNIVGLSELPFCFLEGINKLEKVLFGCDTLCIALL